MKASSSLCLFLSCLCLQFCIPCQSTELKDHELQLNVKFLLEENRNLRESMKVQEEKFEKKIEMLSELVSQGVTRNGNSRARTCHELTTSDPTLGSGMYYIDPDGWNAGDAPIYVYCDKTTGETRVLHDSLEKTNVGHCFEPGCYSRNVKYGASMHQMRALLELSPICEQYIRYDCVNAVFEFNGVQYSWWNDRRGEPKYYWDGNNNIHTCSCGIKGGCVEATVKCNCDAAASLSLSDEGHITDKDHLPITRLNFGRTSVSASLGEHTLGPLRCLGSFQSSANEIPTSCADLWRSGETVSGLYQVKPNDGAIVTVFCDMSKLPEETGHQTIVGVNDVKSEHVYFTAVREVDNYATVGTIPYDKALLNIGNAMDTQIEKFTAPKRGVYFFSLTINSSINTLAYIYHNDAVIVTAQVQGGSYPQSGSAQATLQLEPGDVVYTSLGVGKLQSNPSHPTHFTGYLVQEL